MPEQSLASTLLAATAPTSAPSPEPAAEREAALASARDEGRAAGLAAGADAERQRIASILDSDEAKGRSALARHFALKTAMSPEDAKAALAASPVEAAAKPAAIRMIPDPDVDAADAPASAEDEAGKGLAAAVSRMIGAARR